MKEHVNIWISVSVGADWIARPGSAGTINGGRARQLDKKVLLLLSEGDCVYCIISLKKHMW